MDVFFSVDVETDGSVPGLYSILSLAIVRAGTYDGCTWVRPEKYDHFFYKELKPISEQFEIEALDVNGLDRESLKVSGVSPEVAMNDAYNWVVKESEGGTPVMVAYPLSFDWSFLHWYFVRFCAQGSPFGHSRGFDIKTAFSVKSGMPLSEAGLGKVYDFLRGDQPHTHNALDDAREQAEIFANVFEWSGK